MSDKEISRAGGIGFLGMLFIALMVLKLCGVINWSWWWVTIPLWGPLAVAVVILFGALLYAVIRCWKR
jgi:hypothetical protein